MKRMIKASRYSDKAEHYKSFLKFYASLLIEACDAETPEDFEKIADGLGRVGKYLTTQKTAIKYVVERLDDAASEYLLSANAEEKLPEVKDEIVSYLKGQGYEMTPLTKLPRGFSEAYVIIPANEAMFEDLKRVASDVSKNFGLKPDTGIIGGSWTSYQFNMDGIKFRIGFEDDLDFDPSGKEVSLQLGF